MPGEIADAMLNGDLCQVCGEWTGGGDGFPVTCCEGGGLDDIFQPCPAREKRAPDTKCPVCGKLCRGKRGVEDHMKAVHPKRKSRKGDIAIHPEELAALVRQAYLDGINDGRCHWDGYYGSDDDIADMQWGGTPAYEQLRLIAPSEAAAAPFKKEK